MNMRAQKCKTQASADAMAAITKADDVTDLGVKFSNRF
jgi:hypothetical protein